MPLLDHFHAPLAPMRKWESFHAFWSTTLGERLNTALPSGYFAEAQIHYGNRIEIDVAALESAPLEGSLNGAGGVAVETYAPPEATGVIPTEFPDDIEVQVFQESGGATLVGAIELVSPANKDRPESRRDFAAKCSSYLQRGVGLVVIDIVTERHANLHNELMDLLRRPERFPGAEPSLYAVAYRPVHRETVGNQIDFWTSALTLGESLPTLPLWLRGGPVVPVHLDWTYEEAKRRGRL
jgi:hypothetical protein